MIATDPQRRETARAESSATSGSLARRYAECAAFVVVWIALGFYLRLSPIAYQLVGLALIPAFQLAVARRPLAQLWVRDAPGITLDRRTLVIAAGLWIGCALLVYSGLGRIAAPSVRLPFLALLTVATVPAAFALRQQRAANLRRAALWIAIALVFRVTWRVTFAPAAGAAAMFGLERLPDFLADTLLEFVALFAVDEVAFRGALDPHALGNSSGRARAWSAALFVSVLWSAWHFPAYHGGAKTFVQLFTQLTMLDLMPVLYGILLSFCARLSRTLVPSAAIHALGNAYVLTCLRP